MKGKTSITGITAFALIMLITGAIDSIRNLPATALFGSSLIFFFAFAAIVFLIPASLVSAELSTHCNQKSGVFHWINRAFGEKTAFLAIWLQWVNTMVWFPTILSFIAGTATYFINPELAQNKTFLIMVILTSFWLLTIINLKGLNFSAKFSSFCAVTGMIIPMALIIGLAAFWIYAGNPININITTKDILPSFSHLENWLSLTAIMAGFLGIELATVHAKEVINPQKTFPTALFISVFLIIVTMTLGSLAIAIVLPNNEINLVNGVMQAFSNFFTSYHLTWMIPIITVMVLLGSLGGIVSWVISPVKGLLHASELGFLPQAFTKLNKNGAPQNLLIAQAILVSIICLTFLLMPSVNGSYWLLTALSTQLYVLMYAIMFVAALVLKTKFKSQTGTFTIPGGKIGMWIVCILGLIGCTITLIVGFIPPKSINVGGILHYDILFISGMIIMISPILLFYYYKNKKSSLALNLAKARVC